MNEDWASKLCSHQFRIEKCPYPHCIAKQLLAENEALREAFLDAMDGVLLVGLVAGHVKEEFAETMTAYMREWSAKLTKSEVRT